MERRRPLGEHVRVRRRLAELDVERLKEPAESGRIRGARQTDMCLRVPRHTVCLATRAVRAIGPDLQDSLPAAPVVVDHLRADDVNNNEELLEVLVPRRDRDREGLGGSGRVGIVDVDNLLEIRRPGADLEEERLLRLHVRDLQPERERGRFAGSERLRHLEREVDPPLAALARAAVLTGVVPDGRSACGLDRQLRSIRVLDLGQAGDEGERACLGRRGGLLAPRRDCQQAACGPGSTSMSAPSCRRAHPSR